MGALKFYGLLLSVGLISCAPSQQFLSLSAQRTEAGKSTRYAIPDGDNSLKREIYEHHRITNGLIDELLRQNSQFAITATVTEDKYGLVISISAPTCYGRSELNTQVTLSDSDSDNRVDENIEGLEKLTTTIDNILLNRN